MDSRVTFLVAPTERAPITSLGPTSGVPEKYGVDVIWSVGTKLCGVQRKATLDLVASVRDGRLGRELQQMGPLTVRYLVVEGRANWSNAGELLSPHVRWTLAQQWGVEMSVQESGCRIGHTRSPSETVGFIERLAARTASDGGVSSLLYSKPITRDGWGKLTDRTTGVHFLSAIPLIGVEMAERIWDHFGRVPMTWDCQQQDFLEIHGVGPKRAAALWNLLNERSPISPA